MSNVPNHTRALVRRTGHLMAVTAPSIGGRGGQFVALTILAMLVSPSSYGHFVVLQTLIVGTASILGSTSAVAVNAATARIADAKTIHIADLYAAMLRGRRRVFLGGAVVSAAVMPIGYQIVTGTEISLADAAVLAVVGFTSGTLPLGDAFVAVVAGSGRYLTASTIDAARAVAGAVAALSGVVLGGPVGGAVGLVVADVLLVAVLGTTAIIRPRVSIDTDPSTPREGMLAGVIANVTGQLSSWVLLFGIQLIGGPVALGVYGVASRFASVVTLAPVYFGKTVIGQLADDAPEGRRWSPRSFLVMLTGVSVIAAGLALGVLLLLFPSLIDQYTGLLPVTVALLVGMILRALLIGFGYVCVARRRWTTWVVADLVSLVVTAGGVSTVWALGGDLVAMMFVFAMGNAAGLAVRMVGGGRTKTTAGRTGAGRTSPEAVDAGVDQ